MTAVNIFIQSCDLFCGIRLRVILKNDIDEGSSDGSPTLSKPFIDGTACDGGGRKSRASVTAGAFKVDDDYTAGVLQDFLFRSLIPEEGGQGSFSTQDTSGGSNDADGELGSIFETSFDLTEDRLWRLFHLFDEDNSGTISYDELKIGLASQETGLGLFRLGDRGFLSLVGYLDADKSGDITFEEFSEGIRLFLLRSILQEAAKSGRDRGLLQMRIFDYNSFSLKRYSVEGIGHVTLARRESFPSSQPQSLVEFFFRPRAEDVSVRWINITGRNASHIMKMMALKYKLHPLALEDALDLTNHRPKADCYDGHYFIMIPVFHFKDTNVNKEVPSTLTREKSYRSWMFQVGDKDDDAQDIMRHEEKKQITFHMTSIFVTRPDWGTVITFNNKKSEEYCWSPLRADLKKSYSRLRQYDGQYLAYSILDRAVDQIGPIVQTMKTVIKAEKKHLAEQHYKNMDRIHSIRYELTSMSRKVKHFLRLLVHIIEDDNFSAGASIYLRDVLDNLEIYDEDVKSLISLCDSADQEAEKFQAKQMDSTLYTLTVISATFLPAQFFTGVWGMNFANMPELNTSWGYYLFWAVALTTMFLTIVLLNFGRNSFSKSIP
eukprot:jgi/Psemu1/288087/fgenesh1_pg.235_\